MPWFMVQFTSWGQKKVHILENQEKGLTGGWNRRLTERGGAIPCGAAVAVVVVAAAADVDFVVAQRVPFAVDDGILPFADVDTPPFAVASKQGQCEDRTGNCTEEGMWEKRALGIVETAVWVPSVGTVAAGTHRVLGGLGQHPCYWQEAKKTQKRESEQCYQRPVVL